MDGGATEYARLFIAHEDDIVVNKIWARNGSVAVVQRNLSGTVVSNEFPLFEAEREALLPAWVHWITKTKPFWEQCDDKARGTSGKNRIRPERFLEVEIPLPPLAEQQRIVARLEALAAQIAEARNLRKQATEGAEAVVLSQARVVLGNASAVSTTLAGYLASDRDGVQTGPFGAQLGAADFTADGVPILTIGNIQFGGLDIRTLKHVSRDKADNLQRYRIRAGDLLFARMGTVGRCCLVPEESAGWLINYHIIRVAVNTERLLPRFVHWSIRASADIAEYLGQTTRGATRQGVNTRIVTALPLRVPPLPEQRRIVEYLDGLQAKVDEVKALQAQTAAELDALLPSILQRAFSGGL
ncbi:MAG TPA: restriction endonuclease subunit S [Armatimonadota bacterium]|jgi:type I restriction enzyme S subunit